MFWYEGASSLGYYFDTPFASERAWVIDPWSDDLARAPVSDDVRRNWVQWKKHAPVLARGDEDSTDRWLDSMSYGDLIVRELARFVERRISPVRSDHRDRGLWRQFGRGLSLRCETAWPAWHGRNRPPERRR